MEMDEIGDILVFLSSTNEKNDDKNWPDIIEYAEELKSILWWFFIYRSAFIDQITSFFNIFNCIWFSYNHYLGATSIQTCLLRKSFSKASKLTSTVLLFPDLILSSMPSLDSMVPEKAISSTPFNSSLEAPISKCSGFQVLALLTSLAMVEVWTRLQFQSSSNVWTKIWDQQDTKIAKSCWWLAKSQRIKSQNFSWMDSPRT